MRDQLTVDNDLSTSESCITLRTSNDEPSGGLDVVDGSVVEEMGRDDLLDNFLHDGFAQVFSGDLFGVLSGHHDGVYSDGDNGPTVLLLLVLDRDLSFRVRTEPV
jgi:hypothetical protein